MSTGTDVAPGDLAGLLAEATERGASLLAGGDRLAGPAAVQDDGSELICGDAGAVALGVDYADGTRLAVCLTSALAEELCGGTGPDQVVSGLQVVVDEVSTGLGRTPAAITALAVPGELVAWFDGATMLLGAGIFQGDDVVATIGAAGGAPVTSAPVAADPAAAAPDSAPAASPTTAVDAAAAGGLAGHPVGEVAGDPVGGPVGGPIGPAPTTAAPAPVSMPAVDARNVAGAQPTMPALPDDVLARGLALLSDVHLSVSAELGRTRLRVSDLLSMEPGSVIGLEREAGSPIDLLVNGTLFARAEVIVVDDRYAARITELVAGGIAPGSA